MLRTLAACLGVVLLLSVPPCAGGGTAKAQESPTACAVLVAKTVSDPGDAYIPRSVAECLGAQKQEEASELLAHALELATKIDKADMKSRGLLAMARAYAQLGQKDKGLELLSRALRLGQAAGGGADVGSAACAYAEMGEVAQAFQLVLGMGHPRPAGERDRTWAVHRQALCWADIASACLDAGHKAKALEALTQARELAKASGAEHWKAMASIAVACVYAEAGELEHALEVARDIKETLFLPQEGEARFSPVRYKIMTLIQVANKCCDTGQKDRARQVLSQAHGLAAKVLFPYLRAEMLKDVALTFAGGRPYRFHAMGEHEEGREPPDHDRGLEIARAIQHPLLKAETLDWIAAGRLRAGKRKKALDILSEALQTVRGIEDGSRDSRVSELGFWERCKAGALASLAGKYAQAAQFDRALQIAAAMTKGEANRFYRNDALNQIAAGYLHHGRKEKALEVLAQALESYGASIRIARTYAAAGELEQALNVARNAEDYDRDEVLEELAAKFAEAERHEEALEIAAGIGDTEHKARALARIGARYPKPGQTVSDRARRILAGIARNPGGGG